MYYALHPIVGLVALKFLNLSKIVIDLRGAQRGQAASCQQRRVARTVGVGREQGVGSRIAHRRHKIVRVARGVAARIDRVHRLAHQKQILRLHAPLGRGVLHKPTDGHRVLADSITKLVVNFININKIGITISGILTHLVHQLFVRNNQHPLAGNGVVGHRGVRNPRNAPNGLRCGHHQPNGVAVSLNQSRGGAAVNNQLHTQVAADIVKHGAARKIHSADGDALRLVARRKPENLLVTVFKFKL